MMTSGHHPGLARRATLIAVTALLVGLPILQAPATADSTRGSHEKAIRFATASVVAGLAPHTWTVSWEAPRAHRVSVFVGNDEQSISRRPLLVARAAGSTTFHSTSPRPWVRLVADDSHPLVVTTRVLGLQSAKNLRDAGGYRTSDGRWVRFGRVYRSEDLPLSPQDLAVVESLGLTDNVDLRTDAEATKIPDVPIAGADYRLISMLGPDDIKIPPIATAEDAAQAMRDAEVRFVDSGTSNAAMNELLTTLASARGNVLFHCTGGKDRTGWANAVFLTLLGVPEATVMDDYLLSNTYVLEAPETQAYLATLDPLTRAIMVKFTEVALDYLQAGLDRVEAEYGSMRAYAIRGIGVSPDLIERLRSRYLVGGRTH